MPASWADLFERAASSDVDLETLRGTSESLDNEGETDDTGGETDG